MAAGLKPIAKLSFIGQIAKLSKYYLGAEASPKAFVTVATPLQASCQFWFNSFIFHINWSQCKKDEDSPENVKEAADSVKKAAQSISEQVKKVSDKVNETADVVKAKATEFLTFGAAKIATEVVKKKAEMKDKKKAEEKEKGKK
ncbi:hypothetical protein CCACVL1_28939 [Corchorus capsularis]|uniref:Uncharacterized protein n=1 Tax=Corchorus capsularis TaxID=210143 RepID=A0A1R3G4R2_COCAP|nr:hypothetical protein CCACVL1_28939 [Corchorus capsularis]